MLRLKGEPDDSVPDGEPGDGRDWDETSQDHPAFEAGALPNGEDFDEGLEGDGERDGRWSSLGDTRGLAIAAATFVPTFLIIFFGLPYLLGEPSLLARTPGKPAPVAATRTLSDSDWSLGHSLSEALRGGPLDRPLVVPPPVTAPMPPPITSTPPAPVAPPVPPAPPVASTPQDPPAPSATTPPPPPRSSPGAVTRGSETAAARADEARSREQTGEPMPGSSTSASRSSSGTGSREGSSTPSLPPASARVPEPERKAAASKPALEHRSAPAPRQATATPDPPRSEAEPRKLPADWTPAAAFADREAAVRLASSIERQGYPVEIRQESSSTRPWVVWIGSQPNGGGRRR
jgi:hypothetical protein